MSPFSRRLRASRSHLAPSRFADARFLLPLFLSWVWSVGHAQSRALPQAPHAPLPLPILLGAAVGGLVVGTIAGAALRKKPDAAPIPEREQTFDLSPLPLCEMDGRERIARSNAAWNALVGDGHPPDAPFGSLLHPDDATRVRVGLLALLEGETRSFEHPARIFRPDGALVSARLGARSMGESRRPDRILIGLHDTSELCEAQRELDGARTAVRALYDVMAGDQRADLNAKIKSLLAMGCGRLELPIGVLARRISGPDGHEGLETVWVHSSDRRVRPALCLKRGDASTEGALLGLSALPSLDDWREVPCVAVREGVTYLGAPVEVGGEWFGMLSFSSLDTGRAGFEASEVELLGLMAQWVGGEIEREQAREALEKSRAQMEAANFKLEQLATVDPLTEAKNRRAWNEKLVEEWSRATRYATPLSLILLDVDKFKSYNDTFGHQAGDEVLRRVAQTAHAGIRVTDFFARYGGEEFALILPNTDSQGALILAERLRAAIESAPWKERLVTASFGVATADSEIKTSEDLLRLADEALYAAKERGRNRVLHAREVAPVEAV